MDVMKLNKSFTAILTSAILLVSLLAGSPALGQSQGIVQNIGDQARDFNTKNNLGLPDKGDDPIPMIAQVITYLLSFLGVVFLLMVIYAGVIWMTAMGESKRVEKAKNIIKTGVVGIVVIVLSLAIVQFVLLVLGKAF